MQRNQTIKRDAKGYFYRNLGWQSNADGERTNQPKFLFGKDEEQALDRLRRLQQLWAMVEQHHEAATSNDRPMWDETTLGIARAISRGELIFKLPRQNLTDVGEDGEWADADYAGYVRRMQDAYPVISLIPDEVGAFESGVRKNIAVAEEKQVTADGFTTDARQPSVRDMRQTLHMALKAFIASIDENPKYRNHETSIGSQPITAWGFKLKTAGADLIERYDDRPLSALGTIDSIQELFDFWRNRPKRKDLDQPITIKTVKHRMTALTLFLKWLHKTDKFSWRKPDDLGEIDRSLKETREEKAARARPDQVVTLSEDELIALYSNTTTPLERILVLLGLNCGCKQAEIGTIRQSEVFLEAVHPYADVLGFQTSDTDSFVKRIRQKTGVYGEFRLWPHSVAGLKWLIERRKRQTKIKSGKHAGTTICIKPTSILLTSNNGLPMYRLYGSGNTSQEIPKCWNRLAERAGIKGRTYSALRRTTTNFLRKEYGGEVANVFLQHGSPFEKDRLLEDYSNRPYAKLFEALVHWGDRLRPMFEAILDPFPVEEKQGGANISPTKIREIRRLLAEGLSKAEVAHCVGVHKSTVYRYVEQAHTNPK